MTNSGIIGYGNWGNKLYKKLTHLSKVKFVCNSRDNYKLNLNKVDWVFVATPNNTHFKIVSECLKKKKNVFCEKPLTLNYKSSKKLFKLAKKFNSKLYVDDIEIYKNKKIELIKGLNTVTRGKNSTGSAKELLYKLVYHDLYLLYGSLKRHKLLKIEKLKTKKKLSFILKYKKFSLKFLYDISAKNSYHKINGSNFLIFKNDPLKKMIKKVLNNKVNYKNNEQISLFSNYMIDKIKNAIF